MTVKYFDTDDLSSKYAAAFVTSWEIYHLLDPKRSDMRNHYLKYLKRNSFKANCIIIISRACMCIKTSDADTRWFTVISQSEY